jgi:serine/threonine-protein kinase
MVTGSVPYSGDTPSEVMRKHVDKNVYFTPPDHINTKLSAGVGMVVETMMAKNRENRYRNPDDLLLDLKCLLQGESPMIAAQKPDALAVLAEGDTEQLEQGMNEQQMIEVAGFVNSRNQIIAALATLLALSIVTNVVFLASRLVH